MQDPKTHQKSPFGHHRTTLSGYIFATKACIDNREKSIKRQYLFHMSSKYIENFRLLTAEIGSGVWGTPVHLNGLRVLAALLHGTLVVGVSQTLQRWAEGATYIPQGGHNVGHWPIFLVWSWFFLLLFYSSPNLSGRRLGVYHTSTHDVALVRI